MAGFLGIPGLREFCVLLVGATWESFQCTDLVPASAEENVLALQLALELHGFELRRSTYTWDFSSKTTVGKKKYSRPFLALLPCGQAGFPSGVATSGVSTNRGSRTAFSHSQPRIPTLGLNRLFLILGLLNPWMERTICRVRSYTRRDQGWGPLSPTLFKGPLYLLTFGLSFWNAYYLHLFIILLSGIPCTSSFSPLFDCNRDYSFWQFI